eukprot:g23248.t1
MKIIINGYRPVAVWQWEVDEECCSICRGLVALFCRGLGIGMARWNAGMPFDACCPECKMPGDDCPPVWGPLLYGGRVGTYSCSRISVQ